MSHNRIWDLFAVLLIDVQQDFWTDEIAAAFPEFEQRVSDLLQMSRNEGLDIVHLRASFQPDQSDWMIRYKAIGKIPCVVGTPGAEVLTCANEMPGETLIHKQTYDAFHNPELREHLTQNNKKFLLIAGLVTSVCVLLTAARAAQEGFLVAVIEDCCADVKGAHAMALHQYPFMFERSTLGELSRKYDQWMTDIIELTR